MSYELTIAGTTESTGVVVTEYTHVKLISIHIAIPTKVPDTGFPEFVAEWSKGTKVDGFFIPIGQPIITTVSGPATLDIMLAPIDSNATNASEAVEYAVMNYLLFAGLITAGTVVS